MNQPDFDEQFACQPMEATEIRYGRVPQGYRIYDPVESFWPNIVINVATAEALWPWLFILLSGILQRGRAMFSYLTAGDLVVYIISSAVIGFVVWMFTYALSSVMGLFFNAILAVLKIDCENLVVGAISGGCVGLALSLLFGPWSGELYPMSILAMLTATLLGIVGGYRGAWKAAYYQRHANSDFQPQPLSLRFDLRQILLLVAFSSGLFTLLKLANMLTHSWLIFLGVWLGIQVIAALIAVALDIRFVPRETVK